MNIVYLVILFSIIIAVYMFGVFLYTLYNYFLETPLTNNEGLTTDINNKNTGTGMLYSLQGSLRSIFILILLFYLIFYILYIIITTIIPPTGPATLFIPIRELLLKIPPFEDLIHFGVFRLFNSLFSIFGIDGWLNKLITANNALTTFSTENIRVILYYLLPNNKNDVDTFIDNNTNPQEEKKEEEKKEEEKKEEEEKKKEEEEKKKDIRMKIEEETSICVANNLKQTLPNMTAKEKIQNIYDNIMVKVNCESRSIGKYIRSNI